MDGWKVNDKLSLSAAGRVVYGWRNLNAKLDAQLKDKFGGIILDKQITAEMDAERTAWGFGGQLGLNYAYNDTWNFAMRYDTKIKMEFEADTTEKTVTGLPTISGFPNFNGLGFSTFFPQYKDGAKYRKRFSCYISCGSFTKNYRQMDNVLWGKLLFQRIS